MLEEELSCQRESGNLVDLLSIGVIMKGPYSRKDLSLLAIFPEGMAGLRDC